MQSNLDLPTHAVFGFAVGLVFFDRPEIALLVSLGALIPDLDREYWFIPVKMYRDEQYHRALFHNVFVIALVYLVSPFLSLGVFLHMLLDSFTTSKDRGCEWFFPLSRRVKRGLYSANMEPQPLDPDERIYFYHEDLQAVIEYAEPDLTEPASPWRRVYGPALNSNLLDRGFLCGSIILIIIWFLLPDFSNLTFWFDSNLEYSQYLVGYVAVATLFLAGELDRRDQEAPLGKRELDFLGKARFLKLPIFITGCLFSIVWFAMYRSEILTNLEVIGTHWVSILCGVLLIAISSLAIIWLQTKKGKPPAIV